MVVNSSCRIKWLLLAVFLTLTISLSGCHDDHQALVKNQPAPSFRLQNLQDQTISFPAQFNDRVVIISFWADWCPSCKKEMNDFENLFQQYKNSQLNIVAINIKQDKKTALAFIAGLNLSYEVLFDTNGDIAKQYSVSSLPVAFIINKEGKLHTRVLGETPVEVFQQVLSTLL